MGAASTSCSPRFPAPAGSPRPSALPRWRRHRTCAWRRTCGAARWDWRRLAISSPRCRPCRTPTIGVIYPLSGNSASAGNYSKMAIEVGAEVINNGNADLAKIIPLAKGGGLPGLKGAKVQLIFADNQGTPAAGQNQALRLISEEKV